MFASETDAKRAGDRQVDAACFIVSPGQEGRDLSGVTVDV